jgi:hypothetical protein
MKPTLIVATLALAGLFLSAQTLREARSGFEMTSVFPRETSPGQYAQADQEQLRTLSAQGWELVSAVPFIYRNEEHNNGQMNGPKPVVTQVYPAYFFKRARLNR